MNESVKKTSFLAFAAGILTFLVWTLMLVMAASNPPPAVMPNEPGFQTAILWLELADNPAEIFQILGDFSSSQGQSVRKILDTMDRFDYGFMVMYSIFSASLFIFTSTLNSQKNRKFYSGKIFVNTGIFLAAAMLVGDALENVQLLKLTSYSSVESIPDSVILALKIWTRVKWFALFISCLLLGMSYSSYFGRSRGFLLALLYTTTGIFGLFALIWPPGRHFVEYASTLMGAAWFFSLIHSGVVYFRKEKN